MGFRRNEKPEAALRVGDYHNCVELVSRTASILLPIKKDAEINMTELYNEFEKILPGVAILHTPNYLEIPTWDFKDSECSLKCEGTLHMGKTTYMSNMTIGSIDVKLPTQIINCTIEGDINVIS